ncbi:MAG: hypothetical protein IPH48_17940 [bacterium]|nr:hypothetical protein [bacterium]
MAPRGTLPALAVGVLLAVLPTARVRAEDCHEFGGPQESPILLTQALGGPVRDLAADGAHVCWMEVPGNNQYSVLHWCEEAADGSLLELGSHRLQRDGADYLCQGLDVDGTRVIVHDRQGGWQIVDFTDPAAPTVPWEAPLGSVQGLPALRGDRLYAPTATGLALLELPVGQAPILRSQVITIPEDPQATNSGISRVALDGDYCWSITGDGYYYDRTLSLLLIDCQDPDAPAILDRNIFGRMNENEDETIYSFAVDNGSAVVTRKHRLWTGRPYEFINSYHLLFFARDLTNRVSLTQTIGAVVGADAAIAGDRAWIANGGGVRYLERRDGLWHSLDVIPSGMTSVTALTSTDGGFIHAGAGNQAMVLAPTLPASWPVVGRVYRPDVGYLVKLAPVTGGLVADVRGFDYSHVGWMGCGFVGLSAADPLLFSPTPLTVSYAMDTFISSIVGDFAYTSDGIWNLVTRTRVNAVFNQNFFGSSGATLWHNSFSGLVSYDGSDPAAPVLHGTYFPVSGSGDGQAIFAGVDNLAFFAHGDTVIATRLDAPHEPTVTDRLVTGLGNVRCLAIQDGTLYVGQAAGLALLDVSVEGALTVRGQLPVSGNGLGVVVPDGPVLYALPASGGLLQVFDVGAPESPHLIGEAAIYGYDLLLYGDLLYVVYSDVTAVRRQCADGVPVMLTALQSSWSNGAATLTWNMPGDLTAIRVWAHADGHAWVVPWRREADLCRAVDTQVPRGRTVVYEIQVLADGQWLTVSETTLAIPAASLDLAAPAPNPFNAETALAYSLEVGGPIEVTVLDAAGRVVRTLLHDVREAGDHTVTWHGDDDRGRPVAAGTYFVRLFSARGERVVKAALVK